MKKNTFSKDELKMPEERFGVTESHEKTSYVGIILGVLIVVLMLILAGLYMWSQLLQNQSPAVVPQESAQPTAEQNNEPESTNAEANVQVLQTMSTSDEISTIESDLDSTNLDGIDAELTAIDAELDAAMQP